ncbi:hypothetical protein CRUP_010813 [Coryphaenoides rupestris]|nr:hypothetical protein CRUP_010813 [Coryphaenoides rupestris]
MCPEYYQDFDPAEKVTKVCNPDGQWFHHPESNRVWSNYTQCEAYTKEKLKRISLHKNMFMSFILNSIVTVIWLTSVINNQELVASNPINCKVLSVVIQYTFASSYFWMLCEGIYLHTLIIIAVFVGEQQLLWYYILGWGFPIIPTVTYAVGRGLFYNDNAETTAYMKVVRATLILIPLLGVQFILVPCRPEGRLATTVYEFTMHIFSHFQAQTALRRKWAQWKVAWGKTGWGETPVNSHFHSNSHYHTNSGSSFTMAESSRATVSQECQAPLVFMPAADPQPPAPPRELAQTNGQQRGTATGLQQQQQQQTSRLLDTTDI